MKRRAWIVLLATWSRWRVTARLGVWQLDRAAQKWPCRRREFRKANAAAAGGRELAQDGAAASRQWHRKAQVDGVWLADAHVYLDNRPMNGRPGFFVVTPLLLDDGAWCWCSGAGCRATRPTARASPRTAPTAGPVQVAGSHRPSAVRGSTIWARGVGADPAESRPADLRARDPAPAVAAGHRAGDCRTPAPTAWPASGPTGVRRAQALRLCLPMVRPERPGHRLVCLVPTHPPPTPRRPLTPCA
jgi:cytochrome oxidase assembly protein ShyY1